MWIHKNKELNFSIILLTRNNKIRNNRVWNNIWFICKCGNCSIIQSTLGSSNCIFNLTVNIGVGISTNENLSLRVINGGTQYTLPISVSNGVLTTTTPLSMTTSQTYNFYLQGSFIN